MPNGAAIKIRFDDEDFILELRNDAKAAFDAIERVYSAAVDTARAVSDSHFCSRANAVIDALYMATDAAESTDEGFVADRGLTYPNREMRLSSQGALLAFNASDEAVRAMNTISEPESMRLNAIDTASLFEYTTKSVGNDLHIDYEYLADAVSKRPVELYLDSRRFASATAVNNMGAIEQRRNIVCKGRGR